MNIDHDDSAPASSERIGFVGIGVMGEPMALNLLRAGVSLTVWARKRERVATVEAAGAHVADSVSELFERSSIIILMLVDDRAMDEVLARGTPAFARLVRGRTIVNMATTAPAYSRSLETDIRAADGRYVEAPVSGQRPIAEAAGLVAMAAGEAEAVEAVRPILQPMCRHVLSCGPVPAGLSMKLAVNLISGAMMTAVAEGFHYAKRQGLDLQLFAAALTGSSLASDFLKIKAPKLVAEDFTVQGALGVGRKDFDMMREAADMTGAAVPLLELCTKLWDEAIELGHGSEDVSAVLRALEARASPS